MHLVTCCLSMGTLKALRNKDILVCHTYENTTHLKHWCVHSRQSSFPHKTVTVVTPFWRNILAESNWMWQLLVAAVHWYLVHCVLFQHTVSRISMCSVHVLLVAYVAHYTHVKLLCYTSVCWIWCAVCNVIIDKQHSV